MIVICLGSLTVVEMTQSARAWSVLAIITAANKDYHAMEMIQPARAWSSAVCPVHLPTSH